MDRLIQESRVVTGVATFVTAYTSNIKGDLTQMTYPSGRVVNLNYATGGGCCNSRLASVVDQTTNTTIVSNLVYNAAGETTSRTLGNGVIDTFGYNSRLQQATITAALGASTLMNFTYNYGTSTSNTGRVLSRTDAIQPEHSVSYTYDSIYRLSQATAVNSDWSIAWTFDAWGNRLTQTPQGLATNKVGTQTLAYTNNRLTTYGYDLAGNQTSDGLHNYTFNAENQITQMDGGAAVYAYDGAGRRMKKTVGSETTYYFYGVGGLLCEFTTTNTGATQASSTDRTTYRTSDTLGSAVLIISAAGTVIENNRPLPYGEAWLTDNASSTNDKKFTTYQRDSESNLDYAMNRYLQNSVGRFAGVDRGRIILQIPTSLNRYVYTIDDPVNRIDPDGNEGDTIVVQVWDRFPPSAVSGFGGGVGGSGFGAGEPREPGYGEPISPILKQSFVQRTRLADLAQIYGNFAGPGSALTRTMQGFAVTYDVIMRFNDCADMLGGRDIARDLLVNTQIRFVEDLGRVPTTTSGQPVAAWTVEGNNNTVFISARLFDASAVNQATVLLHELRHLQIPRSEDERLDRNIERNVASLNKNCGTGLGEDKSGNKLYR